MVGNVMIKNIIVKNERTIVKFRGLYERLFKDVPKLETIKVDFRFFSDATFDFFILILTMSKQLNVNMIKNGMIL